jgi:hypothetical protein
LDESGAMDTKPTPERLTEIENAERAAEESDRLGRTNRRCLVCSGELIVEDKGASYLVRCKSENRIVTTSRGI